MRLTVVGCAGSFPGPDSPASCYPVEHDGARILLDLGNGSLGLCSGMPTSTTSTPSCCPIFTSTTAST